MSVEGAELGICLVCGKDNLDEIAEYASLPRVTSDCRPFADGGQLAICGSCGAVQKFPNAKWLNEISDIYSGYAAYYQGDGDEQVILDSQTGKVRRRSDVIMERFIGAYSLPERGKALDIGCGSGVTLSALSKVLPEWAFYGQDLDQRNRGRLKSIPGFVDIFDCELGNIEGQYDLITLIHSLEHFPSPKQALKEILSKLAPGGLLLVEVCNTARNPYDLLIADHLMHFSADSLRYLAENVSFHVESVETEWVPKELTMLAKRADAAREDSQPDEMPVTEIAGFVRGQLTWLSELLRKAAQKADGDEAFGIFGTSICATWLASALGDKVSFFVDEDTSRQNKRFMGKPVYAPGQTPLHSSIYLALVPEIAEKVMERLDLPGREIILPPRV